LTIIDLVSWCEESDFCRELLQGVIESSKVDEFHEETVLTAADQHGQN